jgi:hypothetical protein
MFPAYCTIACSLARYPCPEVLPGSLARQPCPAVLFHQQIILNQAQKVFKNKFWREIVAIYQ